MHEAELEAPINGDQEELEPPPKRSKPSQESSIKRTAEIILVLASMAQMRGGHCPSSAEERLMEEARENLVSLCEILSPKDLVSREFVGNLVRDLGLGADRGRDARAMGSLSIAEKFLNSMKKIEDNRKQAAQRPPSSPQVPDEEPAIIAANQAPHTHDSSQEKTQSLSALLENVPPDYGAVTGIGTQKLQHDKTKPPAQLDSGDLRTVHEQLRGYKPTEHSGTFPDHDNIAKNVLAVLQTRTLNHKNQALPSTAYMNAPISCQLCKSETKNVESVLVCDSCEAGVDVKCFQNQLYNQKIVIKGDWHCPKCLHLSNGKPFPPKYGRVGKSSTTQKEALNSSRVESSQERNTGYPNSKRNQPKTIASGLSDSVQPVPNPSLPKGYPNKHPDAGIIDTKQSSGANFPGVTMENKDPDNQKECVDSLNQAVKDLCGKPAETVGDQRKNEVSPDQMEYSTPECPSTVKAGFGLSNSGQSGTNLQSMRQSQGSINSQDAGKSESPMLDEAVGDRCQSMADQALTDSSEPSGRVDAPNSDFRSGSFQDGQESSSQMTSERSSDPDADETTDYSWPPEQELHPVDWVGEKVKVAEGRTYYQSCCINGVIYKLQDYALFHPDYPNFPSYVAKIQTLWEDNRTGAKWAHVNWCYYPDDLSQLVGRPATPGTDEVYESNYGANKLVGTILGPCSVLSVEKYKKEIERRSCLADEENPELGPIFICNTMKDHYTLHCYNPNQNQNCIVKCGLDI
ncbi:hypothetical protein AMTR_s00013p00237850 [Amborella trichopoda]|uniref:BAH domain-containing protein n=1 Tax=Amborella trichopoda TaxID=13333 RepID=W1PQM9_AMBTC|nr:hypothetical protein AMTR_s00013p00237850 [Amborella trichopoda]